MRDAFCFIDLRLVIGNLVHELIRVQLSGYKRSIASQQRVRQSHGEPCRIQANLQVLP